MLRTGLIALLMTALDVASGGNIESRALANAAFPIGLALVSMWAAYSLVSCSKVLVWSPLLWLVFTNFVVSGFAPLLYIWANPETIALVNGYYDLNEQLLFKTNLLNLASFAVVCFSTAAILHFFARLSPTPSPSAVSVNPKPAIALFLLVGLPVKYFLVMPYEFGFTTWVIPGALSHVSGFCTLALIALFGSVGRSSRYLWPGVALFVLELLTSFISLAKWNIIMTMLAVVLGLFLSYRKMLILAAGFVVITVFYIIFLQDFISFARDRLGRERSMFGIVEVLADYADGARLSADEVQGWWSRQSVANAQGFAIDAYDSGSRGHSFEAILIALVPRVLWPDKPIITIGGEFNFLVNGNPESASTPGIFGEAYWNGGWLMVIAVATYVGCVLGWLTIVSVERMSQGELIFLPIVFFGILAGLSTAGWFIPTYIGGFGSSVVLYTFTKVILERQRSSGLPRGF